MTLKCRFFFTCFTFLLNISVVAPVNADEVSTLKTIKVDQLIDLDALTPDQVYRFEPNYLWIEPGETLRIMNSLGNHTVTSIRGMWPEGVDFVDIAHQAEANVVLTKEGVYGFRCKVHGRHGMYALVVVGSPASNRDKLEFTNVSKRGLKVVKRLIKKMDEDVESRLSVSSPK